MKYFKCALAGSAASVLSGIIYILISSVISFSTEVSGGSFTVVETTFTAGPLLLMILLAGYAIGFFWMLKRTSSPRLTR